MLDGVVYKSVEHAFQAAKANSDEAAATAIRDAPTPRQAHELGRKLPLPADWERRKRPLMVRLLRDKFRRDAALRERLQRTEGKNLIANNDWGETCWGVSGGSGANELGKALSAVRDEIASGADIDPWLAEAFPLAAEDDVASRLTLEVQKGGSVVESIELNTAPLTHVGKHSSCTIQLEHPSISRRHAVILQHAQRGPTLVDLSSKSGVTLNGRRVPPLVGAGLRDGSEIVFGGSSRTHVVRVSEVDMVEKMAARQAQLVAEIKKLEADSKDSANLFGLVAPEKRIDSTQTTCFMGGLSYEASAEDVQEWLTGKGFAVELSGIRIPTDGDGQPKGIAFVDFGAPEAAQGAMASLNGEIFMNRTLKVDLAQGRKGGGGGGRGGGGGGKGGGGGGSSGGGSGRVSSEGASRVVGHALSDNYGDFSRSEPSREGKRDERQEQIERYERRERERERDDRRDRDKRRERDDDRRDRRRDDERRDRRGERRERDGDEREERRERDGDRRRERSPRERSRERGGKD